jgi:hypothetical protein
VERDRRARRRRAHPAAVQLLPAPDRHGESASWAGPVDFGRDDGFTGVLYLKETRAPGIIVDAGGPRQ